MTRSYATDLLQENPLPAVVVVLSPHNHRHHTHPGEEETSCVVEGGLHSSSTTFSSYTFIPVLVHWQREGLTLIAAAEPSTASAVAGSSSSSLSSSSFQQGRLEVPAGMLSCFAKLDLLDGNMVEQPSSYSSGGGGSSHNQGEEEEATMTTTKKKRKSLWCAMLQLSREEEDDDGNGEPSFAHSCRSPFLSYNGSWLLLAHPATTTLFSVPSRLYSSDRCDNNNNIDEEGRWESEAEVWAEVVIERINREVGEEVLLLDNPEWGEDDALPLLRSEEEVEGEGAMLLLRSAEEGPSFHRGLKRDREETS